MQFVTVSIKWEFAGLALTPLHTRQSRLDSVNAAFGGLASGLDPLA